MTCNCHSCKRSRKVKTLLDTMRLKGLVKEAEFVSELYDELSSLELDLDAANAIIDGTWPTADEWIAHKRTGGVNEHKKHKRG